MPTGNIARIERIVIALETPGDSRSMFRLLLDDALIGENLTAAQVHLLVGEILERITVPGAKHVAAGSPSTDKRPL
jgi:hypothetical protein